MLSPPRCQLRVIRDPCRACIRSRCVCYSPKAEVRSGLGICRDGPWGLMLQPSRYRACNLVERFQQCRRIATRYDELAANFPAFIQIPSIKIWLRVNESAPTAANSSRPSKTCRPHARPDGLRGSPTPPATGRGACRRPRKQIRDSSGQVFPIGRIEVEGVPLNWGFS